jgi:hypothetical protein
MLVPYLFKPAYLFGGKTAVVLENAQRSSERERERERDPWNGT